MTNLLECSVNRDLDAKMLRCWISFILFVASLMEMSALTRISRGTELKICSIAPTDLDGE